MLLDTRFGIVAHEGTRAMSQYRKLLFVVSPSMQRTAAMTRAMHLARASGAELRLCMSGHP